MKRFEVHAHTEYSNIRLLDSIIKPEKLINRAIELGLSGIAITDHDCLSAHPQICLLQKKIAEQNPDFKIALGNEIYLINDMETATKNYHFILIAKDAIGHKMMRELSSKAWMNSQVKKGYEWVSTLKTDLANKIKKYGKGHLIATTACLGGELSTLTLQLCDTESVNDIENANLIKSKITDFILEMKDYFDDDFYIECAPGCSKEQIIVNKRLQSIASAFGVKMVIGTDAHFLKKEDRYVHKSYLNSQNGEREVDAFYEYSYLQDNEEIYQHLSKCYDENFINGMIANSYEIYSKITPYSLLSKQKIPTIKIEKNYNFKRLPKDKEHYPTLKMLNESEDKYKNMWISEVIKGLEEKDLINEITYWDRLEEEARVKDIISKELETNMFCYPLTLQHYIDLIWECGSTIGAGRGSSCSGLNHYLLGVTQLDPIEWNLPFFRYLNEARVEIGDIDIDLCPSKRPLILQKIREERGQWFNEDIDEQSRQNLGCTLIATFGTETTKSTILSACRGYRSEDYPDGIDVDTAQYLSSLIEQERGFLFTLKDTVYGNPEKDRKPNQTFIREIEKFPGLLDIMFGIEGLINKRSSHASGVIMFDADPYENGCFMKTPSGDIITQFDLHMCEAVGMTKFDFLVTDIQDKICKTIDLLQKDGIIDKELTLREAYDEYLHPDTLPINSSKIWNALSEGSVLNVFQFDSVVGSQAAKKIKPKTILEMADANGSTHRP